MLAPNMPGLQVYRPVELVEAKRLKWVLSIIIGRPKYTTCINIPFDLRDVYGLSYIISVRSLGK